MTQGNKESYIWIIDIILILSNVAAKPCKWHVGCHINTCKVRRGCLMSCASKLRHEIKSEILGVAYVWNQVWISFISLLDSSLDNRRKTTWTHYLYFKKGGKIDQTIGYLLIINYSWRLVHVRQNTFQLPTPNMRMHI